MNIYRVKIEIGYMRYAVFDFKYSKEACDFMEAAVFHASPGPDDEIKVTMTIMPRENTESEETKEDDF